MGFDLSRVNFGIADVFELLETQKDFDIIVFGVGLQYQDVLTVLLMNQKPNTIIISPVFETQNQQALTVFSSKEFSPKAKASLEKVALYGSSITVADINEDYDAVRLMPCYFSPLVNQSIDIDLMENAGINLAALGIISDKNPMMKAKKFKHMSLEELAQELSSRETKFKAYFLEQKKKSPNFSLKDITDESMQTVLKEINEIKRVQKVKQSTPTENEISKGQSK